MRITTMNPPYVAITVPCIPNIPADGFWQMSFRRLMSLVAMAFLWTGSQIPIYLFGECNKVLSAWVVF